MVTTRRGAQNGHKGKGPKSTDFNGNMRFEKQKNRPDTRMKKKQTETGMGKIYSVGSTSKVIYKEKNRVGSKQGQEIEKGHERMDWTDNELINENLGKMDEMVYEEAQDFDQIKETAQVMEHEPTGMTRTKCIENGSGNNGENPVNFTFPAIVLKSIADC